MKYKKYYVILIQMLVSEDTNNFSVYGERSRMLGLINLSTLILLGYIDFVTFKIPNVVLCGWLGTCILFHLIGCTTPQDIDSSIIGIVIVAGSYFLLKRIVSCSAGDFKLFAVLIVAIGLDNMITTLTITLLISLYPLVCGVKRNPLAFTACLGYIAFLLNGQKVLI